MTKKHKPYYLMNAAELAEATKDLDEEFAFLKAKPLNAKDKAALARMRRRGEQRGRPIVGKGAERINISVERSLLKRTDKAAKRSGMGRSELIAHALQTFMGRKAS